MGSPSLTVPTVSVDVKQHWTWTVWVIRAQELCQSRGGHPGLPVPNSLYGLCGRYATLNMSELHSPPCLARAACRRPGSCWSSRRGRLCGTGPPSAARTLCTPPGTCWCSPSWRSSPSRCSPSSPTPAAARWSGCNVRYRHTMIQVRWS